MDTPPEPGGIPLGTPPGLPSCLLPHPSQDPTRSSRDYVSTKLYTTTATTTKRIQTHIHNTPKLGDFSSLDLYSIFSSAQSSSNHSATSSIPYVIQLESPDDISPATTTRASSSQRLPYNVLRVPKLGDFSSLAPRADLCPANPPVECSNSPTAKLPDAPRSVPEVKPSLGDFSKIFDTFGHTSSRKRQNTASMSNSGVYKCPGARAKAADKTVFHDYCWTRKSTPETSDSEEIIGSQKKKTADKKGAYVCPGLRKVAKPYKKEATAERYDSSVTAILEGYLPPSSFTNKTGNSPTKICKKCTADTDTDWRSRCSSTSSSDAETDITIPSPLTPVPNHKRKPSGETFEPRKARIRRTFDDDTAFEYESESSGPVKVTKADIETHPRFEKDESALEKQRNVDYALATTSESAKEGIHVFVDVSNIYISMMNTIKKVFDIPNQAFFSPPPEIDWHALSQIILRERSCNTRFAACSKRPGNRTPLFIQRLETAGFDVNVLDRVEREGRYVEKLVDETIQGRIGDTVENTKTPGTIIIVTGDGQPAEQAAGFKAYAEHALKKGWNVEVVCWNMGCSQHWKDDSWKKYGLRYRLIKLDEYLGDLFSVFK